MATTIITEAKSGITIVHSNPSVPPLALGAGVPSYGYCEKSRPIERHCSRPGKHFKLKRARPDCSQSSLRRKTECLEVVMRSRISA